MAKTVSLYRCESCGAAFPKWMGRCTSCLAWSSLVEEVTASGSKRASSTRPGSSSALPVTAIEADKHPRVSTGVAEFDRVLGGGAVRGGITLIGGDPGIGKSTLLLQALSGMAAKGNRCLYISGEESAAQTASRARRLGATSEHLLVLAENDLAVIEEVIAAEKPVALVLDSVQTVRSPALESAAGTVSQLREVAARVVERAKKNDICAFVIGHVTKDGALAGPKVLEHLVDTVLAFEGEHGHAFRALRALKNRFGSSTEVAVFEMTSDGMREVPNPSAMFLAERPKGATGSVVAATAEGSRAMLVEVQALVSTFTNGPGRRNANGIDSQRLSMLLAVLERRAGYQLGSADVFVNVAGGARVEEPAIDLALILALASSVRDRPVAEDLVIFGEVGLAGEVRGVSRAAQRFAEASAMGFRRALVPASAVVENKSDIEAIGVRHVSEALEWLAPKIV